MAHTSSTAALPQRDFEVTVHVPHERLSAFELLMDEFRTGASRFDAAAQPARRGCQGARVAVRVRLHE
jgi:hypothetical protein